MPGSFIEVGVTRAGARVVVAPAGEIDIATAPVVSEVLRAARGPAPLVLDLSGVRFMDTAGLRIIVEERRLARERGGVFELIPGPPRLRRLLAVTGLDAQPGLAAATPRAVPGEALPRG